MRPPAAPVPDIASLFKLTWSPRPRSAAPPPPPNTNSSAEPQPEDVHCDDGAAIDDARCSDGADASNDEAADEDRYDKDADEEHEAQRRRGFYGASSYTSASRTYNETEERRRRAHARKKRPSHADYAEELLKPAAIQAVITGSHKCRNRWHDGVQSVPCQHGLWAHVVHEAAEALTCQRKAFLALNSKERAQAVYDA
eukprot:6183516-Pleurochrysis_carterae.AAC.1